MITENDISFLKKRKKLNKLWPFVGTGMFITVAVLYVFLYVKTPALVNPYHIIKLLESNQLDSGKIKVLAALCPFISLFLFIVVGIIIIYGFSWAKLERRYLNIIDDLYRGKES